MDLVSVEWSKIDGGSVFSIMHNLVQKLKLLKGVVSKWDWERRQSTKKDLVNIEKKIEDITSSNVFGNFSN